GHGYAVLIEIEFAGLLVEGKRRDEGVTACIGDSGHVKIALQQSIFARVTVNGNKGSVEADPLIIKDKGKVVFVNRKNPSFRIFPEPVSIPDGNNIGPVFSLQG